MEDLTGRKMDSHTNEQNPYGLKDAVVELERCDKIWETLQLIRSMQDKHLEDIQDWIKREPIASKETVRKEPPMTFIPDKSLPLNLIGEPNLPKPYIKYEPIFNNGNESLPQFRLAEKSRVNLYHCEICSKEYCDYKRFIDHQGKVHGIIAAPKKPVARRERGQNKSNGDLKNRRNSTESNGRHLSNHKLISDENIDLQTVVRNPLPQTYVRCQLCGNHYKNMKRHMVEYHKIKGYIGVFGKAEDKNSNIHHSPSVMESESLNYASRVEAEKTEDQTEQITSQKADLSIQNITNVSKRKLSMPSIGPRKRLRSVSSREEESDTGNPTDRLKCVICGKRYSNYKALRKHKYTHTHGDGHRRLSADQTDANESIDPESSHKTSPEGPDKSTQDKDCDNNNINHEIPQARSSFTKEPSSSDDPLENGDVISSLGRTEQNNLEIKCACGRTFRTTSILANHKFGCKFANDMDICKTSDAKTSSDRDLGISITIKKKNNSYEIVSKESSDEEPTRNGLDAEEPVKNGHDAEKPELCEESSDSSSDNSDSSEFDDQPENLIPEKSKYSENHRILKLKLAEEDVDVDIEEDIRDESSSTLDVNDETNVSPENEHQVTSLRELCKKVLIEKGTVPKKETSHSCYICKMFLGNEEKLTKHIERHKKLMKRSCSCAIKFTSMQAFDNHTVTVHPKCIVCPYCHEKHTSLAALGEHVCPVTRGAPYTDTLDENYPCPNCNISFNNIAWLDSHMRSKHLDPNFPFQCYQCSEKFPNEIARSLHKHKKHNKDSACSVCNQKFQSITTRQKHEAYHRGVGFPCHHCKKTYRSKAHQVKHVKTVHSDFSNDKLQCFICQKSIKTKSFRRHVLRHNSILECEICKKIVYDFRNLERHIMDRHGNENYPRKKCSTCGVSFPTREQLEAHIMVEKSARNEHSRHV